MSRLLESWMCAAALVVSTACSSANEDDALTLSGADNGSSVAAHVDQEVDITLQTIGPGEYSTPSMSSASVRFLDVSIPPNPNPGGVKQNFRFMAESVGTAVITIPHTERSEPFEITIAVEK